MSRLLDRIKRNTRVDENGCWVWTGYVRRDGYVVLAVQLGGGAQGGVYAHRAAYEALRGPVPEGLQLDHLCRVRWCCNPAHMEPVTPRVNYLRGEGPAAQNARKTHCVNGHEFTPENTAIRGRGTRSCHECERAKLRRRRAARKAKESADV